MKLFSATRKSRRVDAQTLFFWSGRNYFNTQFDTNLCLLDRFQFSLLTSYHLLQMSLLFHQRSHYRTLFHFHARGVQKPLVPVIDNLPERQNSRRRGAGVHVATFILGAPLKTYR